MTSEYHSVLSRQREHRLGFSADEQKSVWKVLAAVLFMGNLEFEVDDEGGEEGASIANLEDANKIAKLLEVDLAQLQDVFRFKTFTDPLSKQTIKVRSEVLWLAQHVFLYGAWELLFD